MKGVSAKAVSAFVELCRRAAGMGLMRCSSGNISMRIDDERFLIKASRKWMARLTADDVSLCSIRDGALLDGPPPSVEFRLHAGVLRIRPDANVVMHFQTPFATALGCRRPRTVNCFVIPEIPFYIGSVAKVPYLPPGSDELARAVTRAMRSHDMVLMSNHGQVTVARDADHAIQNAVFFELACEVILRAGPDVAPLSRAEVRSLLALRKAASARV